MTDRADQNARVLDQFSRQAQAYAALIRSVVGAQPGLGPLVEAARPTPADRALDVGCGAGHRAVALARLAGHVTGLDLTPAMLDQARALQAEAGVDNVSWERGDGAALPFGDASFTLVLSQAMFHHAADPGATLAEMRRVCAAGGRIAVSDLAPAPAKSAAFDAIELLRDPSHGHALTLGEFRALAGGLGLQEIAVRQSATALPLAPVLAASRAEPAILDRVRELYARDAAAGGDAFGMGATLRDGQVWVSYPMTLMVWGR